jgi:hypothetical protein
MYTLITHYLFSYLLQLYSRPIHSSYPENEQFVLSEIQIEKHDWRSSHTRSAVYVTYIDLFKQFLLPSETDQVLVLVNMQFIQRNYLVIQIYVMFALIQCYTFLPLRVIIRRE